MQSQTRKPLQWNISLVSKEIIIASTSNKVLYFGNNEQILAQVDDSYNWYTLSAERNDEIELEAH